MTRIAGTLHEDQCTFLIYITEFFLEREMFQKEFVEQIIASIFFFILLPCNVITIFIKTN